MCWLGQLGASEAKRDLTIAYTVRCFERVASVFLECGSTDT